MFDCASQPDHFDRIPDSVVLLILNRIGGDVKDLVRCSLVSKRFHDLVREVPNIVFKVDSVNWISKSSKPRWTFRSIFQYIVEALLEFWWPMPMVTPLCRSHVEVDGVVELQTFTQVLKNFTDIRCLKIEFPSWEVRYDDYVLLWKADFGSKLEKIVILCADSVVYPASSNKETYGVTRVRGHRIAFNTPGSYVIADRIWKAAYAKHYLLHPIVVEHSKLESLVLTDANGKGTVSMNRSQLEEFRLKPSPAFEGTLNMQVSYADNLELPDGVMLKGPSELIVILPSKQSLNSWVDDAIEEPFGTAVRMFKEQRIFLIERSKEFKALSFAYGTWKNARSPRRLHVCFCN